MEELPAQREWREWQARPPRPLAVLLASGALESDGAADAAGGRPGSSKGSCFSRRGREEKDCWRRTQHKRSSLCDTILDGMAAEGRNLLGLAEVAELLRTTRRNAIRMTGLPDFPEPVARLRATRVWKRADVDRWAKRRKPDGRRKR